MYGTLVGIRFREIAKLSQSFKEEITKLEDSCKSHENLRRTWDDRKDKYHG